MNRLMMFPARISAFLRGPTNEFHKIPFDYQRAGRPFVKGTIEFFIINSRDAHCRRQKTLGRITLDQWVGAKLLDFIYENRELVKLHLRRQGRQDLENVIGCFLTDKLPEVGAQFHALQLDE